MMEQLRYPFAMPDRIAVDAQGYGWRVWDGEDNWSMVPVNPDNTPIPQPVTYFERADKHEAEMLKLIDERDRLESMLDRFAYAVAPESEIGEHSSANDPWANALAILEGKA